MNKVLILAKFFLNDNGIWMTILRLFQGDYERDVREQIHKFHEEQLPDWRLSIMEIHTFDNYGSTFLAEIHK